MNNGIESFSGKMVQRFKRYEMTISPTYYSGHKESNNLHRDIVILRVLRGAELTSQSAFERNIQPAWQSLKLLTRRYLNSGQGNKTYVVMYSHSSKIKFYYGLSQPLNRKDRKRCSIQRISDSVG